MSLNLSRSFTNKVSELFGEDDDLELSLLEMALLLTLLNYYRALNATYYRLIYTHLIDVIVELSGTLQEAYGMSPNVTKALEMIYNNNVSRSIYETVTKTQDEYYKRLQSQLITIVSEGGTVGDLKKALVLIRPDGELTGQSARMMTVYRTEYTRVRSGVKLFIYDYYVEQGYSVDKQWVYTYESRTARENHLASDGMKAGKDGYFTINGKKTKAPGMFGDPAEDINCRCDMHLHINDRK